MGFFASVGSVQSHLPIGNSHRWRVGIGWHGGRKRCSSGRLLGLKPSLPNGGFINSNRFEFDERTSPNEVKEEIQKCYNLIRKLGKGVVYLGSSRFNTGHLHYQQAMELGREIAKLLDCTTWTGAGPGLMDAVMKGALAINKPVGGFKICKEAGEWTASNFHAYLPDDAYLTCRFFSARKHGLVDAATRSSPSDMTAIVALPGGIGTLDEMFEILALIQLERIGSEHPVPFILLNYDSFYTKLLDFMVDCENRGVVAKGEVDSLWKVCDCNFHALEYLADFYGLPPTKKNYNILDWKKSSDPFHG